VSRKQTSDVWWKNAVVYCLDVETFLDWNGDGCGDLVGLTERLDYLAGLGISCIWLMPFYPSARRDDGYDIVDHYGVDGRLGTPGDLAELVRTAADRGIRVIADLVINHTSDRHPWFREARKGPESPYHDFYVWCDEKPDEEGEPVFPDAESSLWHRDEKCGRWYLHHFYRHQPDLNVANADVRDELAQILGYWLEQGLSGFRIDAVPFLLDTTGMPEHAIADPHELLRDLRRYASRRRGDVMLLGEVNLPPDELRAFFGESGDELHMCFNFPLNQALYLALARGEADPIERVLRNLPEIPADCQWANFVRNHDELTLDKLSSEEREEVFAAFGPDEQHQLFGRGLRRRLPTMLRGDQRRIRMVYSLMFSLPGTPVLFYGEEIGMAENLAIEGRMSVRAPMQWTQERHGGFTTARRPVRPVVREPGWRPDELSVAQQRREGDSLLNWMERLIRRRRECPELGWGSPTVLDVDHPAVLALRCDWGEQSIVVVHSLVDEIVSAHVPIGEVEAAVDLFAHGDFLPRHGKLELTLQPYGHHWFRLRRDGQRLPP
jgi:trehalose synthase